MKRSLTEDHPLRKFQKIYDVRDVTWDDFQKILSEDIRDVDKSFILESFEQKMKEKYNRKSEGYAVVHLFMRNLCRIYSDFSNMRQCIRTLDLSPEYKLIIGEYFTKGWCSQIKKKFPKHLMEDFGYILQVESCESHTFPFNTIRNLISELLHRERFSQIRQCLKIIEQIADDGKDPVNRLCEVANFYYNIEDYESGRIYYKCAIKAAERFDGDCFSFELALENLDPDRLNEISEILENEEEMLSLADEDCFVNWTRLLVPYQKCVSEHVRQALKLHVDMFRFILDQTSDLFTKETLEVIIDFLFNMHI